MSTHRVTLADGPDVAGILPADFCSLCGEYLVTGRGGACPCNEGTEGETVDFPDLDWIEAILVECESCHVEYPAGAMSSVLVRKSDGITPAEFVPVCPVCMTEPEL